jgi:hypothetical protein
MQVVIDIDDKLYNRIKCLEPKSNTMLDGLMRSVQNGTPLSRGHGRLIDADAFITTLEAVSKRLKYKELWLNNHSLTVDDVFKAVIESLQNEGLSEGDSPTIIEAESEDTK